MEITPGKTSRKSSDANHSRLTTLRIQRVLVKGRIQHHSTNKQIHKRAGTRIGRERQWRRAVNPRTSLLKSVLTHKRHRKSCSRSRTPTQSSHLRCTVGRRNLEQYGAATSTDRRWTRERISRSLSENVKSKTPRRTSAQGRSRLHIREPSQSGYRGRTQRKQLRRTSANADSRNRGNVIHQSCMKRQLTAESGRRRASRRRHHTVQSFKAPAQPILRLSRTEFGINCSEAVGTEKRSFFSAPARGRHPEILRRGASCSQLRTKGSNQSHHQNTKKTNLCKEPTRRNCEKQLRSRWAKNCKRLVSVASQINYRDHKTMKSSSDSEALQIKKPMEPRPKLCCTSRTRRATSLHTCGGKRYGADDCTSKKTVSPFKKRKQLSRVSTKRSSILRKVKKQNCHTKHLYTDQICARISPTQSNKVRPLNSTGSCQWVAILKRPSTATRRVIAFYH